MEKKYTRRKPRSILALISVLSIIIAFILVCYLVLNVLYNAGVYQLPSFLKPTVTKAEETYSVEYDLDIPSQNTYAYTQSTVSDMDYKKFLEHSPYADSYFLKATIYQFSEDPSIQSGVEYWIWKNGSKYKVSIRDSLTSTILKVIVCNGSRVMISDEINATVDYYDASDYKLIDQTPFPNFSKIFEEGYEIVYFGENEENLFVTMNDLDDYKVTNLVFNKNKGLVSSFELFDHDILVNDFVLNSFEKLSYTTDYMFNFD